MPFEKLTHTKISRYSGKPLAQNSVKAYVKLLNRIAKSGIDTKQKLLESPQDVIDVLNAIYEGTDENSQAEKRQYYSAIFYALDEYSNDLKKEYYEAFQAAKIHF